jgi:hypothetical protein
VRHDVHDAHVVGLRAVIPEFGDGDVTRVLFDVWLTGVGNHSADIDAKQYKTRRSDVNVERKLTTSVAPLRNDHHVA